MRNERLNAKTQGSKDAKYNSNWIEALILCVYAAALRLYPAAIQADFGDEMKSVFAMTLRETTGQRGLVFVVWRELVNLPVSLITLHRQANARLPASIRQLQQTRWFVRIIGALLSLFLLSTLRVILTPSYNLYSQAVPFVGMLFSACISLLLALRWERVGGLLTIASGAAIGCCMTLYMYVMALSEIGLIATVLIGFIWALPFLIFGILFYELSKQSKYLPSNSIQ